MAFRLDVMQRCTNPTSQIAMGNKLCIAVPNICGSLVWNWHHVTLLVQRILKFLQHFWIICAPLPWAVTDHKKSTVTSEYMTDYHKLHVFHKRHVKAQSCQLAAWPKERTSQRHSQFKGNSYDKTQIDTDVEKSWWHHYKSRKIAHAPVQWRTHKILPISRLAVPKCKPPTLKRTPSYRDLNDTTHKVWAR